MAAPGSTPVGQESRPLSHRRKRTITDSNGQKQTPPLGAARDGVGVARNAFGCGEKRLWVRRETDHCLSDATFAWGESKGGAPPLVPQQRRGITRLFFAYFLFPLKRK